MMFLRWLVAFIRTRILRRPPVHILDGYRWIRLSTPDEAARPYTVKFDFGPRERNPLRVVAAQVGEHIDADKLYPHLPAERIAAAEAKRERRAAKRRGGP